MFIAVIPSTVLASSLALTAQQDDVAHGDAPAAQELAAEAREAMARFTVSDDFEVSLFAAEPLMAHPVAFTIDSLGRFFVAETYRHSKGVTDMRGHMDWLDDDLAAKTVADRVAMYRKHLSPERFEEEFATESERVVRLVDTDGDGEADQSTVFATGFDDPAAGIGAGVLTETLPGGGTKLWFTCIPDMWELVDADGDGVAEERKVQSTGYGLRVALLGHDLHGPIIGPYGRLYYSCGDRGFNVENAEGETLARYGTGAVLRCELDGSNLEIFCDGLRNPQEIVFDEAGNLFTLDNNSDGGDQARWTMLLEGSDTGWRQAYQWVREPHNRGPWNQEKMWHPFHPEQPAYLLPCIKNFTSGPSGMTLYPGTGFGPEWNGRFFVCDFRGNPGYSGIYSFRNEPHLSGFSLEDPQKFVWDALPTDVEFGPDGNLYWSDWVTSYNKTGKGRIYRMTPKGRGDEEQALVDQVAATLQRDLSGASREELLELFAHPDRRVRERAQHALAGQLAGLADPDPWLDEFIPKLGATEYGPLTARHLIRAIVTASRTNARVAPVGVAFTSMLDDAPDELEIELMRGAAECLRDDVLARVADAQQSELLTAFLPVVAESLVGRMSSGNAHIQRIAVEAAGVLGITPGRFQELQVVPAILSVLELGGASDPWLRHVCIRALERLGAIDQALAAASEGPEHVRRAVVVLLRRAGDERIAQFLEDESALVRAEAVRAIYDVPITGAMGALAERLPYLRADDEVLTYRRALQANRELGTAVGAQRLADFATNPGANQALRVEAIRLLGGWTAARTRDGVVMDHRPLAAGAAEHLAALAGHPLMALDVVETAVRPVDLDDKELTDAEINAQELFGTQEVRPPSAPDVAKALIDFHRDIAPAVRPAAGSSVLRMLAAAEELDDGSRIKAFEALMERYGDEKRSQGFATVARTLPGLAPLRSAAYGYMPDAEAAQALDVAARVQDPVERREAIRVLSGLHGEACSAIYASLGLQLEGTAPELVEWLAGAETHPSQEVRAVLADWNERFAASEDALDGWRMSLEGGDVERGRAIFTTKSETSCMRCHVVSDEGGSEAGPALDGVAGRLTHEQLLLAVVEPNAEIAEGYEAWLFSLDDGEVLAGRILEETEELVVIETSKKEVWEVPPGEITTRKRDVSAMPADVSTHLSRAEMRDLMAFLQSLGD